MVQALSQRLTLQEFLQQPETKPASEYINGKILQKPMPKGSHLGWFVDPEDLSILFLEPQQQPVLCQGEQALPVWPGLKLTLTVNQVFDWLKMG